MGDDRIEGKLVIGSFSTNGHLRVGEGASDQSMQDVSDQFVFVGVYLVESPVRLLTRS